MGGFNVKKVFWALVICALFASPTLAAMSDADFIEFSKSATLQQINEAISEGANVNAWDGHGWTPLKLAAASIPNLSNPEVIIALIKAGADVNARCSRGGTALMFGVLSNNPNPEVITILLEAGADVDAVSAYGKTALDFARQNEALKDTDAFQQLYEASR